MRGLAESTDACRAEFLKLVVSNGDDYRIIGASVWLLDRRDAVFVLRFGDIDPGVVDLSLDVVFLQFANDVDYLGVAEVRTIFLEGQAKHKNACAVHLNTAFGHGFNQLGYNIGAHAVIEPAPGENDFRVVADGLGFVGKVVRINTDTMSAHKPGTEWQEIPFGACGLQHGLGVDTHFIEDEGEFVDQRDIDVALGVLDDLGRFRNLDAGCFVGTDGDDLVVDRIDQIGHFRRGTCCHFFDSSDAMLLVARVDTLRAVAGVEILVELEAGEFFEDGNAIFFGGARVDRRFVNDDITLLEYLADGFRGFDQRGQVGLVVPVDGSGHGDDEAVALP